MVLDRVGISILAASGDTELQPRDMKALAESAFVRVTVNNDTIAEGPAMCFQSGYGLSGNSVQNNQGICSIGVPSTSAARKLRKTQYLTNEHVVRGFLTFQARTWTAATT